MSKRNTSIRINGKHYDVMTGTALSYETGEPAQLKPTPKSIDGVLGGPVTAVSQRPAGPIIRTVPKPATKRALAVNASSHTAKPSATLMRHAVTKPGSAPLKRHTRINKSLQGHGHLSVTGKAVVVPKMSLHSVDSRRSHHASQVVMSPRVARYAHQLTKTITHDVEQVALAIDHAVVIPQIAPSPVAVFRPDIAPRPTATPSSDIFEQALRRATGHEEPAPKLSKKSRRAARSLRRRMVSFSAGAVVLLALVGGFGYHHSDANQFRMAANQAGFAATMPGYQAKGYDLADINVSGGYLNVRYQNATRSYAVAEKPSTWDSQTLAQQITSSKATSVVNTIKKDGRTIYLYGSNQAAWVNNGILYQVLGNGSLASHEFVEIATSM